MANDDKTLIDYKTMKTIMKGTGLEIEELTFSQLTELGFANVEGGFRVHEAILLVDKAKAWFKRALNESNVRLKLNRRVNDLKVLNDELIQVDNTPYDFVINCTYNQAFQYISGKHQHYFDLCFSLLVATKQLKTERTYESFGIFDGTYPSLEPYGYADIPLQYRKYRDHQLFQIFHVQYTSYQQFNDIDEARKALHKGLPLKQLREVTDNIIEDIAKFYPHFLDEFEVIDHILALKTKVRDLSDTRPLLVFCDKSRHNRFIHVFSSKLTSIFTAEERVLSLLEEEIKNTQYCVA